jgi:hypothetical protein
MACKAIIALFLLTALNVTALIINVSPPSRAATASYQEMLNDPDCTPAVNTIAEQCRVNVNLGRLQCGVAQTPGQR